LTWTSAYAHQCIIEPDIGQVGLSGSVEFTPTETTVYTLTASGPGGSITDTLTVTVITKPQIAFSADPATSNPGGPVTLTWAVSHADSCVIEPDVGSVGTSGSVTVIPTTTTVYTLSATGPGGTATATVSVSVVAPISIQILYPADGATLNQPDTMVRGTFTIASGKETGITVNGKVAMVYGNTFVVNHLPLRDGENIITVTATDVSGFIKQEIMSIYLDAEQAQRYVRISTNTESGAPVLEITLDINGSFNFTDPSISYSGPDVVEFLTGTEENSCQISISTSGIYYFTVAAMDELGYSYSDTMAIMVVDTAVLDGLLKAKWSAMRQSLIDGDIEKAVIYFESSRMATYSEFFHLIPKDLISGVIPRVDKMDLIESLDGIVRYVSQIEIVVNGLPATASSFIIFSKDGNGLWKIGYF
jgi:hypothetical protein